MLPEPKRRIRWLTREEAERLIAELPEHLAEMVRFSLATGLRKSNVTGLEWPQVDLQRRVAWIHPDQAKARKAIGIALNAEAMLVLRRQTGKHERFVFTYQGKQVRQVNTKAWKRALERAGARSATHLGLVAHTGGDAAGRASGIGRMGVGRHGAPICTPGRRPFGSICRENRAATRDP